MQWFDKAIAAKPTDFNAHFLRYTALTSLKRFGEALDSLSRTLELKPDYIDARVKRAQIFIESNEFDKAEIDLNYVLEKKPSNTLARKLLTKLSSSKQTAQAADFLKSNCSSFLSNSINLSFIHC